MNGRPVALVTPSVPPYRREPFRLLDEAEGLEVLAWADGRPTQAAAARLVASGRYRAVICGLGGRVALPATYLAARRARVPFVLWASLWSHPRTPAHLLSYLPTRHLYRAADAVVTYGPHVSRYVERHRGDRGAVFVAPQACAAELRAPATDQERRAWRERTGAGDGFLALFAGRLAREKGTRVLVEAWRRSGVAGTLALAGDGIAPTGPGVLPLGRLEPAELRGLYAAADVLVLPSIRTATFTEPWGFVVNESMHQGTPPVASEAVGAVAGGLVRDGRNGLVVPAGDADALAARLRELAGDQGLRERLGAAAREDVAEYTPQAWVRGVQAALRAAGAGPGEHEPVRGAGHGDPG
jgi:glycosyltransferase involved in cell wall biosynthesis